MIKNKKSIFGLPEKVIHCKKCLMTNQKPFSMNESKNKDKPIRDTRYKKSLLFNLKVVLNFLYSKI